MQRNANRHRDQRKRCSKVWDDLLFAADPRDVSVSVACRACGAPIIWAVTVGNGRRMPLNETPEQRVVIRERDGKTECKVVATYMPHWATCPRAAEFRGKNGERKAGENQVSAGGVGADASSAVAIDGASRASKP